MFKKIISFVLAMFVFVSALPLSLGVKTKLFICVLNMGQVVITREFV